MERKMATIAAKNKLEGKNHPIAKITATQR